VAKIGDFGISRIEAELMTKGIGTPVYMPPEALLGSEYSAKVDIYAFGLTLWECVTSQVPFDDIKDSPKKIIEAVTSGSRPAIGPEIPKPVRELIEKCWSQESKDRPDAQKLVNMISTTLNAI